MKQSWDYIWVILYSISTIKFSAEFRKVAIKYVDAENLKYSTEYEQSLSTKTYILTCVNSYLGLTFSIIQGGNFKAMNLLLTTILSLKAPYLAWRKFKGPLDKFGPRWKDHTLKFASHCRRYPETYKANDTRLMHFQAERQLMLDPMPGMLIAHYNGLVIQFGWITFFAPAFPAGVLFLLGVCFLDLAGEINNMVRYW